MVKTLLLLFKKEIRRLEILGLLHEMAHARDGIYLVEVDIRKDIFEKAALDK